MEQCYKLKMTQNVIFFSMKHSVPSRFTRNQCVICRGSPPHTPKCSPRGALCQAVSHEDPKNNANNLVQKYTPTAGLLGSTDCQREQLIRAEQVRWENSCSCSPFGEAWILVRTGKINVKAVAATLCSLAPPLAQRTPNSLNMEGKQAVKINYKVK